MGLSGGFRFKVFIKMLIMGFLLSILKNKKNLLIQEKKKKNIFGWKFFFILWFKCDIGCVWDKIRM